MPYDFDPKRYPILYVDDETVALDLFRYNFGDEFTVLTATSAQDALPLVSREQVALVFSDQRMPGMSGIELFAEIKKTHPDVIRILATAYADFQSVVAAINAGHVYHYVEKPWDDAELRLILRRGLEHYHLLKERDRLQAERIQTLESMARSNRLAAVGTLAAGIAHEIRNPLSAIITFHQMLPDKIRELGAEHPALQDEFWTKFAHIPLREVERIRRLVQELLDFARDSGTNYRLQPTSVAELIEQILPMIESDIRHQGIQLERDFQGELPDVLADSDKIKQVLINLLLNAVHACQPGGTITLSLNVQPDTCQIQVRDTGCGISKEDLERVFDPFFTTRDPGSGTGLGLTMCHHIVSAHAGKIHIESEPGQGTVVSISLPRASLEVMPAFSGENSLAP